MKIVVARLVVFLACMAFGLFIFWVGGEKLERGQGLQLATVVSIVVSLWVQMFPGWPRVTR